MGRYSPLRAADAGLSRVSGGFSGGAGRSAARRAPRAGGAGRSLGLAGLPAQPRLRSGLPLGTAIARRESGSGSSPPPDLVDSGRGRGSYRVASVFSLDVGGDPLRSALR